MAIRLGLSPLTSRTSLERVPTKTTMRAVKRLIADKQVIDLIRGWLPQVGLKSRGLGAGTVISNLLANLVLSQIDEIFTPSSYSSSPLDGRPDWIRSGGRTGLAGFLYVRYGDDIVVLGRTGQVQPIWVMQMLAERLERMGLTISWGKSSITELTGRDLSSLAIRLQKNRVNNRGPHRHRAKTCEGRGNRRGSCEAAHLPSRRRESCRTRMRTV